MGLAAFHGAAGGPGGRLRAGKSSRHDRALAAITSSKPLRGTMRNRGTKTSARSSLLSVLYSRAPSQRRPGGDTRTWRHCAAKVVSRRNRVVELAGKVTANEGLDPGPNLFLGDVPQAEWHGKAAIIRTRLVRAGLAFEPF